MTTAPPSHHLGFPMQHVGLHLFSFGGKSFLICVGHWSDYPLYQALHSLSSEAITSVLTSWFNTLGWPFSIRSDGALNFVVISLNFAPNTTFKHELSSPYNPKSNGLAEAAVKSVKNILRNASGTDPDTMLFEWRNVPRSDGYSPAQLLFGRQQRTCLPIPPSQVQPHKFSAAASSKDITHDCSKYNHDQSKHFLPMLSSG